MNATPFLLILFLVSTCHGEEQNVSSRSGILSITNTRKKIEMSLEATCPDPKDIEPCECTNHSNPDMDCSKVQDEEQLRKVFSAVFPTTKFNLFRMYNNNGVKVLEDGVFGDVSFQNLDINYSALETVEDDALTSSLSTVMYITIEYCHLTTFPFEKLAEFTSLLHLGFYTNKIHTLPPLSSSSLRNLALGENLIKHISPDNFKLLPTVERIFLNGNDLTEIQRGTFADLPKLEFINLSYNKIRYLQSLTFELVSSTYSTTKLLLDKNNIDFVEVDTFKGVTRHANITMNHNALIRLPEDVWWPVLMKDIDVELGGNSLACGCDVAWLVRDPLLLMKVTDARCDDGTMVTDRNPADFDHCD